MRETEASAYRFGSFELNPRAGELRKHGIRIKLQDQPLQILLLLLEHPGVVVTREEIQNRLWPPGTHVDYDNAINSAMRKLRDALNDTSENPRFIETLPRRGYRFLGNIERELRREQPSEPVVIDREDAGRAEFTPPTRKHRLSVAASGTLLICAALIAVRLRLRPEINSAQLIPVPLTAAEGWEQDGTFSPDGNQFVYSWDETAKATSFHLYVKMIASGRPVPLTAGPNADYVPTWSPDGRTIAFVRDLGQANAVYLIPPLGGTERKVADGYSSGSMSWSPDNRFLAVACSDAPTGPSSLYLISAENGQKSRLTIPPNPKTWDVNPAFSPDGRRLLFTRCDGPFYCALWLLDLTADYRPSGGLRLLRNETRSIGGSAWTPDGRDVVYAVSEDGGLNHHLMRIPATGTAALPERLSYAGERSFAPAIAAHGNRLTYTQDLSDFDIWQVQAGKLARSFISSTRLEYNPQYSPDGKHVAFSSNRSGMMEIWVGDQNGGNQVQLTHFQRHSGTPRWSPDGHWIAFDRHLNEGWRIFVMPSEGGQARRLTSDDGHEVVPSWSRDGQWIYYASNRTGRFEIWKALAGGGKGVQITRNGGFTAFESIDGESLYYVKSEDSGLWVIPVRGGTERMILESVIQRCFVVTEDGIYYIPKAGQKGVTSIDFHEFATGKKHEIAAIKHDVFEGMTVSPDRKTILFSVVSRSGSNLMVVENFH